MSAEATLSCPDGCFELTYQASIDSDDVDDRDFLNELGVPTNIARNDSACPNCGQGITVDWGDDR